MNMTQLLQMPDRLIHAARFQIDTNRINARQNLPNMNKLEKWAKSGVITFVTSEAAHKEMVAGHNPQRVSKADGLLRTQTCARLPVKHRDMTIIANILFPGKSALSSGEKKDVEIVFNAKIYGYALVTNDGGSKKQPGGILGNRSELKKQLKTSTLNIWTDCEAIEFVRQKISFRDARARCISNETGHKIPDWVGKD